MFIIPDLPPIPGREPCSMEKAMDLLRKAAALGHHIRPEGYLNQLSVPQIEALLEGRTDA